MNVIGTAASEYANRPEDERYPSVAALVDAAKVEKGLSGQKEYRLGELRAVGSGGAVTLASPKGEATLTHWAFGQLSRVVGAPAGYLRELPPGLAAEALNYGLQQHQGETAKLLVRGANGRPQPTIRSLTSETYGRVWDADLYGGIASQIAGARGNGGAGAGASWDLPPTWDGKPAGAYRGDRDSFLVLVNGGSIVQDPTLTTGGDGAMYRGLLIRNSEVGACSVTIEQILYRYVCGNHNLWGAVVDKSFRRRHVGQADRATLREVGRIAYQWTQRSAAADEDLIRRLAEAEVGKTREDCVKALRELGATKEQAEAAYASCERLEAASPRSFWGLAQGITRESQAAGHQDGRYELDRLAMLVLARGRAKVAA